MLCRIGRQLLAGLITVITLVSITIIPASAGANDKNIQISASAMNEISVRAVINGYFSQRLDFLNEVGSEINVINDGMKADEEAHKAFLEDKDIVMVHSSAVINEINCWDNMAAATATESVTFLKNGVTCSETIIHDMTLYCNKRNEILIQSDAYKESITGFCSASYISPEDLEAAEANVAHGGSGSCIRYVAYNEVGKSGSVEDSTQNTKYHAWYKETTGISEDGSPWCAIFVSWCAAHANISSDIIYWNAAVQNHRNKFDNEGRYYVWADEQRKKKYGQEYTAISAGDIIFTNDTAIDPGHIGIVYYVSGDLIWIVDGNYNDKVSFHSMASTNTAIVGFAKPRYLTSTHTQSSEWSIDTTSHWHKCVNCNLGQFSKGFHNMEEYALGLEACTVCGYDGPVDEGLN